MMCCCRTYDFPRYGNRIREESGHIDLSNSIYFLHKPYHYGMLFVMPEIICPKSKHFRFFFDFNFKISVLFQKIGNQVSLFSVLQGNDTSLTLVLSSL